MKKPFVLLPALFIFFGFYAGYILDENAQTLLEKIKLSDNDAKNIMFSDIAGPSFYFPGIKELKSIALNDRPAQVEVIGKYVKDFTITEEFNKRYNEFRESRKPTPPEKPQTADEMKKQYQADIQKSIHEMKVAKSEAPADQKSFYDETIKMMEEQLKEIDNPDNTMFSPEMDQYSQQGYDMQMEQYKKEVAEWELKYPVNNSNFLIKSWLESFLTTSKDVDFNAQTAIDQNGKTLFVKQEYERKDNMWKLCFRGGKETTEAARNFAQSWLSELK